MAPPRAASMLRSAPITIPCLAVLPLLAWWSADQAGSSVTRWAPGALAVLVLLAIAFLTVPNTWSRVPRLVLAAAALLLASTAWSFATIGWADDRGAALEGADRGLLYLALFCLFALWRQRTQTATVLVTAWTFIVIAIALVAALRLPGAAHPQDLFLDDRLSFPAGYPNASAATFAMAIWPAIVLAASARVPIAVRAACAGGAVLCIDLALLAQSRGALIAMPATGLLTLALVPGRLRTLAALLPVAAGVGLSARATLHVSDVLQRVSGLPAEQTIATAGRHILLGGVVAAAIVAAFAAVERHRPPRRVTRERIAVAWRAVALAAIAVAVVGGGVALGDPVHRVDSAWDSFKGGYKYDPDQTSRLVGGLGSNRYDFYRVALDVFKAHPVVGHGVDGFQQDYLRQGRSTETPRYPHSWELRALSQTGLIGALLLVGALGCAFAAGLRGMRAGSADPDNAVLRAATGGAALMGATYLLVHGSADWFFELAGLGAPLFVLLGLAAGLAPARVVAADATATAGRVRRRRARGPVQLGVVAVGLVASLVLLVPPLLSALDEQAATSFFVARPLDAYQRLHRATDENPFSDRAPLLEGSIALRFGDLARADRAFAQALDRVPDGQYATLQRGAIASARGDRVRARALLARAVQLAPRDPIAREALQVVSSGGTVDVTNLTRRILADAQQLTAPSPTPKG